ncbi:MAG: HAD-IA family hydrolase [Chloroflexota bacterium]|nr:HAD-IA family hydrolase [Chloroflexota bacterium]
MIKAVLFDLGDTLWHFPNMPPHVVVREETVRRINALLLRWGIEPEGELIFLGRDIRFAVEEETERAYRADCVSPDYRALCREAAARLGLPISEREAAELWDAWNLGGQFFGRTLFPDAIDTLRWLQEQGFLLGSVTNRAFGGPRFLAEMGEYGIDGYFQVISISCDVGYMKPHPAIFHHALEALGVAPEETMMVGDSLRADVGGAKALGMTAAWKRSIGTDGEPEEQEEDALRDVGGPLSPGSEPALSLAKGQALGELDVQPDYTIDDLGELTQLPILNHA